MPEPTAQEKIDVCMLHLDRLIDLKNEKVAVREMRKHAAWYLKGVQGNGKVRNAINQCETRSDLASLLNTLVDVQPEEAESDQIQAVQFIDLNGHIFYNAFKNELPVDNLAVFLFKKLENAQI